MARVPGLDRRASFLELLRFPLEDNPVFADVRISKGGRPRRAEPAWAKLQKAEKLHYVDYI